jgi:hypothetical protein
MASAKTMIAFLIVGVQKKSKTIGLRGHVDAPQAGFSLVTDGYYKLGFLGAAGRRRDSRLSIGTFRPACLSSSRDSLTGRLNYSAIQVEENKSSSAFSPLCGLIRVPCNPPGQPVHHAIRMVEPRVLRCSTCPKPRDARLDESLQKPQLS